MSSRLRRWKKIHLVHVAQVLTYLKLANLPCGLLMNFNVTALRLGVRRLLHPDLFATLTRHALNEDNPVVSTTSHHFGDTPARKVQPEHLLTSFPLELLDAFGGREAAKRWSGSGPQGSRLTPVLQNVSMTAVARRDPLIPRLSAEGGAHPRPVARLGEIRPRAGHGVGRRAEAGDGVRHARPDGGQGPDRVRVEDETPALGGLPRRLYKADRLREANCILATLALRRRLVPTVCAMTRPGDGLRRIAARVCGQRTMEWLVEPIIVHLQAECDTAAAQGEPRAARRLLWRGYGAFWKALGLHCIMSTFQPSRSDLNDSLHRVVAFSFGALAIVTALMIVPPMLDFKWDGGPLEELRLILLLIPQALPPTFLRHLRWVLAPAPCAATARVPATSRRSWPSPPCRHSWCGRRSNGECRCRKRQAFGSSSSPVSAMVGPRI